jgi:hypothetical protein
MTIKIELQDQSLAWVSIEEVNVFSESKNILENTGEFICYLKFTENVPYIFLGEPLKNEDSKPILFKSYQEAIDFLKKVTTKTQP